MLTIKNKKQNMNENKIMNNRNIGEQKINFEEHCVKNLGMTDIKQKQLTL